MTELLETIKELPLAGLIPLAMLFVTGIVLLLAGRRALRTVVAFMGLAIGGTIGWELGALDVVAVTKIPAWAVALTGALVLTIIAFAAYRMVLAGVIAALLGFVAPICVVVVTALTPIDFGTGVGVEEPVQQPVFVASPSVWDEWLNDAPGGSTETIDLSEVLEAQVTGDEPPQWREWIVQTSGVAMETSRKLWTDTQPSLRWVMVAAAGIGALLGLLLGAAAPAASAAIVTSLGGSFLLLCSTWTMSIGFVGVEAKWMTNPNLVWLIVWVVTAVIGLSVQWMFRPKQTDK